MNSLIGAQFCWIHWWARRESNSRSLPCQGNVITPRPRALGNLPTIDAYLFTSVGTMWGYDMIFDILPVHPFWEQEPANRVRPFAIFIFWPLRIGPYVLHFRQKPSIEVMVCGWCRNCMNSLANFGKKYPFYPLLCVPKSLFLHIALDPWTHWMVDWAPSL